MPQNDDLRPDPNENKRWLLGFGLAVLLAANLALVAVLALGAWRDFTLPPMGVIPANAPPDVRVWFETYRDRVDSLNRLVTALIGLSALYSVVLGLTAYLSAQFYVDRFKESLKDARDRSKEQLAEFQERFPSFDEMNRSVSRVNNLLAELVPDVERLADHEASLTPQRIQRIQHYERSIAFFEFLKDDGGAGSREVYRRLGRFYRALYEREKKRLKARKLLLNVGRRPADCGPEEVLAYGLFDRACFYIDHLLGKDQDNFAALNEKAILIQEIDGSDRSPRAMELFLRSIENNGNQQRALYWLGYIQMGEEDERALKEAEGTFTRALASDIWEREKSSPERKADLFYNRACVRSRLGGNVAAQAGGNRKRLAVSERWAETAISDLMECSNVPSAGLLENLLDDVADSAKDLWWLDQVRSAELRTVRKRLGDATIR